MREGSIEYSDDLFAEICKRISDGRSIRSVCSDPDMPSAQSVFRWLKDVEGASEQYARACDDRADYLAELAITEAYNEATDSGSVQRDRLKVDTIKWFTSKLAPKKYGERIQTEDITQQPRQLVIVSPKHGDDKTA
jgi:hypothetical protein